MRREGSKNFTRGFLVCAPGLTIKDRLRVLQPNDPDSYYASREVVPNDMLDAVNHAKIVITNFHAFKLRERIELSKGGRQLLQGRVGDELNTQENRRPDDSTFYTLGVLKEIEGMIGCPLYQRFDLVFGTSTGAIIAALICIGKTVGEIEALYRAHVVKVVAAWLPGNKSAALASLAADVFGDLDFSAVKTRIGIVATNWDVERPFIFKADAQQTYSRKATFEPCFGVRIGDAVQASCSAYPLFHRKAMVTTGGERVLLADGGYRANNPTLYAIADASAAMKTARDQIRVVSIGVGEYPAPTRSMLSVMRWVEYLFTVRLLQKTMEISTQSMDQLREVLFADVLTVRINERFTEPEMATDMFEHDLSKLNMLWSRGRQSFERHEKQLRGFLL